MRAQAPRGLACHQRRHGRHVLALAPAGALHPLARQRHGGARGIGITEEAGRRARAGLGRGQSLIGGEGGGEGLAGPAPVGEQ